MKIWEVSFQILLVVCVVSANERDQQDQGNTGRSSASMSLRAFKAPGEIAKKRAEMADEMNERLESVAERFFGKDKKLMEKMRNKGMFKKAVEDPICSMDIDCADASSRTIIDGIEYPNINGMCNNLANFSWGMAGVQHLRLVEQAYENSKWNPRNISDNPDTRRVSLPNARVISNVVHKTTTDKEDSSDGWTLALFYFMQFIDHDIIKTPDGRVGNNADCCSGTGAFCLTLYIQESDDGFFPQGHCMEMRRSDTVFQCDDDSGFQNQYNEITAYIDASMVYGSSEDEMDILRTGIGGRMKESTESFMPESADAEDLPCNETSPYICFEAGDTRANVHPGLTSYHTIFIREHNRIASYLAIENPTWSDDRLFMETRKIVAAEIQHIVYNEMLPAVLDTSYLSEVNEAYAYNASLDASIFQAFSIAYRYHNLMPSTFHMTALSGNTYININNEDQFNVYEKPSYLLQDNYQGIDKVSLGFTLNKCPFTNGRMNDAARDKLFFTSTNDSFDLAAINILRGREWGTPAYIKFRALCGLGDATTWTDLNTTHTADEIALLESVYDDVRDVDLWTGLVTETNVGSSISGPTQSCLVARQFFNLKNGDRFWYENGFSENELSEVKKVTLARILCDNLNVSEMREDVFDSSSGWVSCDTLASMDLSVW